ncbi:MAG: ferritin family protein [Thermodesulfobacteriota bacterium]
MKEPIALKILKNAILLEKRGKEFYRKVAQEAKNRSTREFFKFMADEEDQHILLLSDQFKQYTQNKTFKPTCSRGRSEDRIASLVFTGEIIRKINAASFEAAAVSAAMSMEERAIRLYTQRGKNAKDRQEKAMYRWLAEWESKHLEMLSKIDRELTEAIWNDNSFWPF